MSREFGYGRHVVGTSFVTTAVLSALIYGAVGIASASASSVAGVTFVDGSYPGHSYNFHAATDFVQNPINPSGGPGQTLSGSGTVGLINSAFYTAPTPITFTFGGYSFVNATTNADGSLNQLFFTGGTFNFQENGSTWLTAAAHPEDAAGDTLIVSFTYPSSGGISASAIGYADVTGGPAGPTFDTNTQTGGSDFLFTSIVGTSTNAPPGYIQLTNGSSDLYTSTVPEPTTIGLLAMGLLSIAFLRRRYS